MRRSKGLRTRKGNVTAKARRKYGRGKGPKGKRFPIFDKKSARSALWLRGHARSASERSSAIRRAARFLPGAAKKARAADKRRGKK